MLKNQDIICISSIDWDFIWQGHQEIMSTLAKNGNRVLFIENTGVRSPGIRDIPRLRKRFKNYFKGVKGIRKEADNLYIFSPIVLPFPYSRIARWVNRFLMLSVLNRWIKAVDFADSIVWTFLPTGITLDIINNINKRLLVYYCIDNFAVSSASTRKIRRTEKKVLQLADLVFVTSKALYDYCAQQNNKVHFFPFGVNFESFERVMASMPAMPGELRDIKNPIVGYVGGIHKWIDQGLVKSLAQNNPEYSFVFIGPLQTDISALSGIRNIYFLGSRKHEALPNLIRHFSVTMIPYHVTDYTKNVYPTKLNEYLALGKAVISTDLPEIRIFNQKYGDVVSIGKDANGFSQAIRDAIKEDTDQARDRRIEIARDNSWQRRIEEMSGLIEEAVERKLLDKESRWKEQLLTFYHAAGKRMAYAFTAVALAYLLLFHTSFAWYLAEPLKVKDNPHKADAIVVFAGGVGESGEAGQGYKERIEYAVELYKTGYASHIVVSSGYTYAIRETDLMKAWAISKGVPAEEVLIENEAGNTYENVKFTNAILERNGWRSVLVISSPYHMRRVFFVYNKIGRGMEVHYTPVPYSRFYAHGKGMSFSQINGIMHEYLGILYYWWKGYI